MPPASAPPETVPSAAAPRQSSTLRAPVNTGENTGRSGGVPAGQRRQETRQGYSAGSWANDQANNSANEASAKLGGGAPAKPSANSRILDVKASSRARGWASAAAQPLLSAHCNSGVSGSAASAAAASSARHSRVACAASMPARECIADDRTHRNLGPPYSALA